MVSLTPAPEGKFPALEHTAKLLKHLLPFLSPGRHALLLVSHETPFRNDTDREMPHRAESNFFYLTGCDVPGASVIVELQVGEDRGLAGDFKQTLYVPPQNELDIMWSIPPPSLATCAELYSSHAYVPLPDLTNYLAGLPSTTVLHTLPASALFPELPKLSASISRDETLLLPALHKSRLVKTPYEVTLMQRACDITSQAHEVVMRALGRFAGGRGVAGKGGRGGVERGVGDDAGGWEIEGEGDAEALFVAACRRGGSKSLSYMPIIASGMHAAVLHYICNHSWFTPGEGRGIRPSTNQPASAFQPCSHASENSSHAHAHADPVALPAGDWTPQVLLIDAGTEFQCYGADITRTMPVGNGGRFTPRARKIYSLVLAMQKEAEAACRAGVHWDDLQLLTHKALVRGFVKLGIFKGDEDEILRSGVSTGFFPHGLGHSIGLDVHDVPSASKPAGNDTIPAESARTPELYTYLRLRLPLEPGMLVTIEPGCYFSPHLLARWRDSPYIDHALLAEYESVGGVRIEDVVLVEQDRCRNLTGVVREVEDVERLCSGA